MDENLENLELGHRDLAAAREGLSGDFATALLRRYLEVRQATEELCRPLAPDDFTVQSMPEASPAKWHLGHTTWFFETLVLGRWLPGFRPFHPRFAFLFNSYYNALGDRLARPSRGLLTRPTVDEVLRYRRVTDGRMAEVLEQIEGDELAELAGLVVLGLHHEQQHQELILTDIKHAFWSNPMRPQFRPEPERERPATAPLTWLRFPEGLHWIGYHGLGFSYDNERPRHRVFLEPFQLASRQVTCGEYLDFIADGGYRRPELWLSDGWDQVVRGGWSAPLYWERDGDRWQLMTLGGMRELELAEPACHLSFYEADAFARWADARLPTEAEWEVAASPTEIEGNFVESGLLHPAPAAAEAGVLGQLYGDAWQWTQSPYSPYPGFRPEPGAVGEYNGKFMCNQMVLRGGSCASPRSHLRPTYRNFWAPHTRFQFSGFRLARDA